MSNKKSEEQFDIKAIGIHEMAEMSLIEYEKHLEDGELFYVDPHGNLRSTPASYPIAVNKDQLKVLISYLRKISSDINRK